MSRENVDLTLLMYDVFNRRDLDAMLALMDDEVEVEVEELHDLGDVTLAQVRGIGHGVASTAPIAETWWQSIRWRDGLCIWWRNFATEAEALETTRLETG